MAVNPAVERDFVAGIHQLAHKPGVLAGSLVEPKEGGPHPVPAEGLEHRRSGLRVGAVVEGEGELAASGADSACDRKPKPLVERPGKPRVEEGG